MNISLISSKQIGNTTVNIYDNCIPTDPGKYKQNLTQFYDTLNKIARDCEECGVDTSDWFYT